MPQAVAAVASWVANAGISYGGSTVASQAFTWGVNIAANAAIAYGANALLAPDQRGSAQKVNYNQTMPPRKRVLNRARIDTNDSRMLNESKRNYYQVNAICDAHGALLRFDRYWLHGDEVNVRATDDRVEATDGNPNKYKGNGIWWLTRKGLPTETSYYGEGPWHSGEDLTDLGAGVWSNEHRGDGIASLLLVSAPVEQTSYQNVYPHGHPRPSILPVLGVYDWRLDSTRGGSGACRLTDPSTWVESWNPVLWLAQVEAGPVERDDFVARFERKVAANLACWTQAANDCDETVLGKPRYQLAGWYYDNAGLAEVRKAILNTCDGYLVELSGGALHIQVGRWRAPTLTIPRDHIKALRWRRGNKVESAVNELVVSYMSEEHDWYVVPGTPWRDEADISRRGLKSREFPCPMVPRESQARRLAKIAMGQAMAPAEGTVRTTLFGLNILFAAPPEGGVANRRWIWLQRDRADGGFETVPVEIVGSPRIDMKTLSVEFAVRQAEAAIYDWTSEDETGEAEVPPDPTVGLAFLDFRHPEQTILIPGVL